MSIAPFFDDRASAPLSTGPGHGAGSWSVKETSVPDVLNVLAFLYKADSHPLADTSAPGLVIDRTCSKPLRSAAEAAVDVSAEIQKSKTVSELAAIARLRLAPEFADRLIELNEMELEEGDESLSIRSIQIFLDYCFKRGVEDRPLMAKLPDGPIQAVFASPVDDQPVSIRFFPNERVLVYYVKNGIGRAHDIPAQELIEGKIADAVPEWI